jgi:hypothetical protein
MRLLPVVVLLLSGALAGCDLTAPESCTAGSTSVMAEATLRDSGGVELAVATVVVQAVEGDTVPAHLVLVTLYPGSFSRLVGHVLSATLVDGSDRAIHEFVLERPDVYIADGRDTLRDPATIALLDDGLSRGSLALVLVTDLPNIGVLRAPLVPNAYGTGYHAPICYRRGLFSD